MKKLQPLLWCRQWNLDIIGVPGVEAEAELLAAMITFFQRVGLGPRDVGLKVSTLLPCPTTGPPSPLPGLTGLRMTPCLNSYSARCPVSAAGLCIIVPELLFCLIA